MKALIHMIANQIKHVICDGGGGLLAKSCLTLATPWTIAGQAPLPIGFSRQEYWSGLPFPFPEIYIVSSIYTIVSSEDLKDLLTPKKKKQVLFIIGDWNAKIGS